VANEGLGPGEAIPFVPIDAGERVDDADAIQVATIQWTFNKGTGP
jgi:hypothetical protein